MSLYFNSSKSKCDLGDTIVKTKFDEDCKSLLSNSLETLIIPNDAEEINIDWSNMTSIKTLKFEEPYKLDYVGGFDYFTSLETVYIPDSVTKLGNPEIISDDWGGEYVTPNGFSNSGVKTVVIGENSQLKTISNSCFNSCSSLQSITLPNSVTSLGDNCFYNCGLTSINIPNSVISIENKCFQSCSALETVTFEEPCQITELPANCFNECSSLQSITIPNSVTSLVKSCFYNCNELQSINIPNTIKSIGSSCFTQCSKLSEITFEEPCQITTLPWQCFYSCSSLKSFTIPSSVKTLEYGCFYQCYGLTSITIPSSVTTLGDECFGKCNNLTTIYIDKPTDSIAGAPWGATNATIIWNDTILDQFYCYKSALGEFPTYAKLPLNSDKTVYVSNNGGVIPSTNLATSQQELTISEGQEWKSLSETSAKYGGSDGWEWNCSRYPDGDLL